MFRGLWFVYVATSQPDSSLQRMTAAGWELIITQPNDNPFRTLFVVSGMICKRCLQTSLAKVCLRKGGTTVLHMIALQLPRHFRKFQPRILIWQGECIWHHPSIHPSIHRILLQEPPLPLLRYHPCSRSEPRGAAVFRKTRTTGVHFGEILWRVALDEDSQLYIMCHMFGGRPCPMQMLDGTFASVDWAKNQWMMASSPCKPCSLHGHPGTITTWSESFAPGLTRCGLDMPVPRSCAQTGHDGESDLFACQGREAFPTQLVLKVRDLFRSEV